jgi:DNA polymerase-3 subunit beta
MAALVMETPATSTAAESAVKITLPLKALQKAMVKVVPVVERRTTIAILSSVRIEQHANTLEFAATCLDLSIAVKMVTAETKPARPFLLPAIKFNDYSKLLGGGDVSLTVKDERATLKCGRSTTKMLSTPVSDFPMIATAPKENSFTIAQNVLNRLLHFVGFAISTEESRYTLAGALLEVEDGKLGLIATDGHRLARYTVPTDAKKVSVLLSSGFLAALGKTIDEGSGIPVVIESTDQNVFVNIIDTTGSIELGGRRMSGQFPNYKAVLPSTIAASFFINSTEAAEAVRRCLSFADAKSGGIKVTVCEKEIQLHAASGENGETDETIDVIRSSVGESFNSFSIGFNGQYLLDAFSRVSGEVEVRFSSLNNSTAILLTSKPSDGELFEYVVMPTRIG